LSYGKREGGRRERKEQGKRGNSGLQASKVGSSIQRSRGKMYCKGREKDFYNSKRKEARSTGQGLHFEGSLEKKKRGELGKKRKDKSGVQKERTKSVVTING